MSKIKSKSKTNQNKIMSEIEYFNEMIQLKNVFYNELKQLNDSNDIESFINQLCTEAERIKNDYFSSYKGNTDAFELLLINLDLNRCKIIINSVNRYKNDPSFKSKVDILSMICNN